MLMVVDEFAGIACDGFTVYIGEFKVLDVVSYGDDGSNVTAVGDARESEADRGDSREEGVGGVGWGWWWGEFIECEFG